MKGGKKRKSIQSRFKTGHSRYKGCEVYLLPCEPKLEPYKLRNTKDNYSDDGHDEYFVSHVGSEERMWNESFRAHQKQNPNCQDNLRMEKTRQAIISTDWLLHCETCPYRSESYMMYRKVSAKHRGQKHSTLNLSLGAALLNSPIGPQVCTELLLTIGIDPGNKSGLQKVMNAAGEITVEIGLEHLSDEQEKLRTLCEAKGVKSKMAEDSRFNNHQSSSVAPGTFQAATQAVSTFCSFTTNKVIEVFVANKHCAKAFALRGKGRVVNCPDHEGKCSANMKMEDPIGNEGRYTKHVARKFKKDKTPCDELVVDCDSHGGKDFADELGGVEILKDPIHLARGQKRNMIRYNFSNDMFAGHTAAQKAHSKTRFCEDVRLRCTGEINAVIEQSQYLDSDQEKRNFVTNKLKSVPDGIVHCYRGDHSKCQNLTYACKPQENKLWPKMRLKICC